MFPEPKPMNLITLVRTPKNNWEVTRNEGYSKEECYKILSFDTKREALNFFAIDLYPAVEKATKYTKVDITVEFLSERKRFKRDSHRILLSRVGPSDAEPGYSYSLVDGEFIIGTPGNPYDPFNKIK